MSAEDFLSHPDALPFADLIGGEDEAERNLIAEELVRRVAEIRAKSQPVRLATAEETPADRARAAFQAKDLRGFIANQRAAALDAERQRVANRRRAAGSQS